MKDRCKRIESKEPLGLWFWWWEQDVVVVVVVGGQLKTVWKVEVARLGCCSLTGGKHDAALRGKKNHSGFLSCKYSVLFCPCFWYGVVCSKLVRVSSIIASPQIHHLITLTAGPWRGELQVTGLNYVWMASSEHVWIALWLWGTEEGLKLEHLGFCLPACLAFPVGSFGVLWHETPAGLCLLALSISSHFLDSTRPSWILIVPSITHRPCLPEPHILWID